MKSENHRRRVSERFTLTVAVDGEEKDGCQRKSAVLFALRQEEETLLSSGKTDFNSKIFCYLNNRS